MIEPAGHRVLVIPDKTEEVTEGGIILTQTTRDQEGQAQIFGKLVAVGKTAWKSFDDGDSWAVVGDRVAFAKYGGFIIKDPVTRIEYRLLNDEDICAVIKE